ncbi:glycosyltransferase [Marimonas sp. MJW-29]|uniref:glycosyltransferase n=1 Tax=Sulfitobacter sediminis TaxID=3234186 RepID=UPI003467C649
MDLTRSLRRAGGTITGIDRVERAYLDAFLNSDADVYALLRTAFGYVLLDRSGMAAFRERLCGQKEWPEPDRLSRIPRGRNQSLKSAETLVRAKAIARCLPGRLGRMMAAHLPRGIAYFNVGHSNLTERVLVQVAQSGGTIHVFVHDMIPLEHPEFQKLGTVRPFRERMQRVSRLADRVIHNSTDTRDRAERFMREWGRVPPSIVAPLGVTVAAPDTSALPVGVLPNRPYFVTIGTIEPRKNHAFLLDLWEDLGPDPPPLLICGSRGWSNADVFRRLDALGPDGPIRELRGLPDPAIAALVQRSAGALFPSLAEGFGLPPAEALMLGSRVLCNDLAVLRGILEGKATFATVSDKEFWIKTINDWGNNPPRAVQTTVFVGPTWEDHFKTVLRLT